ncbi:mitochondrial branched-chain alpha-ketoacid dehydrogenase complex, E1 alpha [Coccomyxa subellipsoidea C-169]|uniref:3-methyl-2-oxobutanoate dehydrogenase (2-methylpropanoyl-transferring) n=1 Tax=Coccomyxa subellipsoidea (strain C-169) TaxID=574566 RepID=I0YQF8_COCSC|nr:mitochondrial branched-chain alpha-ketoacid dehydrogenase complex, E1 alpha [Coccomyxa subellipsoidea C-169]EIE20627.1 mitochondrial branched-chain alpha-ketoacid dehydrogenase complex, E1 alpha [Coccomyxa subellipsoidea C-169]|eukprot:XP_005645171.1 mitochondrial branched-chain alpha-ketoacid dehydrogenase complex, E1 alpha [Coccomyxa subellipsoidea C-169]
MDFPGGRVPFTDRLSFVGGAVSPSQPTSCYRTLDSTGACIEDAEVPHDIDEELALKMYETMVKLQTMDVIFYEAQRQGRFSFFMTSNGEEATIIGSAAALSPKDHIFSQYREHGALLYRGFSFLDMANQCFGNVLGHGKGRQMPIHYGSKAHNFQTVSAPLATQLPHAVGAAYALKLQGQSAVTAVYFGEGAASEGDFHAALNFAATLSAPVLFICRNNGWAISTPANEQYKGDGIVGRGPSYGIPSVRVDGGDARAVFSATAEARRIALEKTCPVLIEAMSYRSGHHSTSDDSSRYRTAEEMSAWRARDPATRFHNFIVSRGWWDDKRERQLRVATRKQVVDALTEAQKGAKPPLEDMFTDVYKEMPWHLQEQAAEARAHAQRHPESLHGIPLE